MRLKCDINYFSNNSELTKRTAKEISEGKVIGWFQGSMEWGPRALGNRSIICDPRRSDMKEILNIKIKRRSLLTFCTISTSARSRKLVRATP